MVLKEEKVFCTSRKKKGSVRKETNAVSGMIVQSRQQKLHHPLSNKLQKHEVEVCREKRNVTGRSHSQKLNRQPCKYFLKGTCTESLREYWHPPECQVYKSEAGCKFGAECLFPHWKVEEPSNKKAEKRDMTKMQQLL